MSQIYLDYNSTTPVDPLVLTQMLPWFSQKFGNAASKTHSFGWEAEEAVKIAREQVAAMMGAETSEIIFTSGATEAINLAMRGAMNAYREKGNHLITCVTEHKAVLDTCADLAAQGSEITFLSVDREGRIDLNELINAIRKETVMVCIMMANNETGVLQDTEAIGKICREKNVLFFSDVTQAAGKMRIDVNENCFDLACLSAHKFYGPKGVGALYIRRKNPRVTLLPQITGGGHERGLRSGTLNVPGIVGMGAAAQLASQNCWEYGTHTSRLRVWLEQGLTYYCKARINGSIKNRLPNTSNLTFDGTTSSDLIKLLQGVAVSFGSACTSANDEPSHVLKAMGISEQNARSSIRISIGKFTTEEEVKFVVEMFKTLRKT